MRFHVSLFPFHPFLYNNACILPCLFFSKKPAEMSEPALFSITIPPDLFEIIQEWKKMIEERALSLNPTQTVRTTTCCSE